MSNRPVFILAPPRSYTSLVCGMLGQHPQLYGLPEVNLFAGDTLQDLKRWFELRPNLRHGLLRAFAQLSLGEQSERAVAAVDKWLDQRKHLSGGELFAYLIEWAAPRQLVEKSPLHVIEKSALQRIFRAYPNAYFVHLTRHPVATCESIYKLRHDILERVESLKLNPMLQTQAEQKARALDRFEEPEQLWLDPHLRIMEFLAGVPAKQQLRIRGETLVAKPEDTLASIARWLGMRDDAEAINAMLHPERSPYACVGPANARFGNDINFLEKPAFRPHQPQPRSLSEPVRNKILSGEVRECAHFFGYQ